MSTYLVLFGAIAYFRQVHVVYVSRHMGHIRHSKGQSFGNFGIIPTLRRIALARHKL